MRWRFRYDIDQPSVVERSMIDIAYENASRKVICIRIRIGTSTFLIALTAE